MKSEIFRLKKTVKGIDALQRTLAMRHLFKVRKHLIIERNQKMAVYANDLIGMFIFLDGIYERDYLETFIKLLEPLKEEFGSWVVLDAGANIGNHSIYFSKLFGRVHAFEPNPSTYQLLAFNCRNTNTITSHNIGLGEREESLTLYEDETNYGRSSTIYNTKSPSSTVDINITRLDDLEIDFGNLKIIKIDVEGMEVSVLKGGLETIKQAMPIIILEQQIDDFSKDKSGTESTRLLASLGYKFCWIEVDEKHKAAQPRLLRIIRSLTELIFGKTTNISVLINSSIPQSMYPMLIALPPKMQSVLGRGFF